MGKIRINTRLIASLSRVLRLTHREVSDAAHIPLGTWYRLIKAPEDISVQQLLGIANGLYIPVRRFFSEGKTDIVGTREDYITDSTRYQQCYYDSDAVRAVVGPGTSITWRRVGEVVDMHYTRASESLLAERPVPVARVLTFADAFGFSPFQFIVDPNPERKAGGRTSAARRADDALRDEIAELRQQIAALNTTVTTLTDKYTALLDAHNTLARRISVNIEHIQDSHLSIAAEPTGGYGESEK